MCVRKDKEANVESRDFSLKPAHPSFNYAVEIMREAMVKWPGIQFKMPLNIIPSLKSELLQVAYYIEVISANLIHSLGYE